MNVRRERGLDRSRPFRRLATRTGAANVNWQDDNDYFGELSVKTVDWLTVFPAPPKVKDRFQFAPTGIIQKL